MLVVHDGKVRKRSAMNGVQLIELYVFVLAGFVGFLVITRVPPLLHTPLMSATNAISAISLVGLAGAGRAPDRGGVATVLGFVAVTCATINVVGGFIITDRMLRMFQRGDGAGRGQVTPLELASVATGPRASSSRRPTWPPRSSSSSA